MLQALNLLIGIVGVFAAYSTLVSTINEIWNTLRGTREVYLWWGVARLVGVRDRVPGGWGIRGAIRNVMRRVHQPPAGYRDEPSQLLAALFGHPWIRALCARDDTSRHPPHIPSDIFAAALTDVVMAHGLPPSHGRHLDAVVVANVGLPEAVRRLPPGIALTLIMQRALQRSGGDRTAFEAEVARTFDESMAQVTDWFKQSMQWQSVLIGLVLSAGLGLDAVHVGNVILGKANVASLSWPPPWVAALYDRSGKDFWLSVAGIAIMGLAAFVGPTAWFQLLTALTPLKTSLTALQARPAVGAPTGAGSIPVGDRPAAVPPTGNVLEAMLSPERIRQLQAALGVTPSGTLDASTRQALRDAQQRLGMPVDGRLSATLWSKVVGTPCVP